MGGGGPGGEFAGVIGVAIFDDAVEDADADHALADAFADKGGGLDVIGRGRGVRGKGRFEIVGDGGKVGDKCCLHTVGDEIGGMRNGVGHI